MRVHKKTYRGKLCCLCGVLLLRLRRAPGMPFTPWLLMNSSSPFKILLEYILCKVLPTHTSVEANVPSAIS